MCTFDSDGWAPKSLVWNENTGKARITFVDKSFDGHLTLRSKHDGGFKYNFRFEYGDRSGIAESEYIVFRDPFTHEMRATGVDFVRANGERHVYALDGNFTVNCTTP
jgi:hypothetical protein